MGGIGECSPAGSIGEGKFFSKQDLRERTSCPNKGVIFARVWEISPQIDTHIFACHYMRYGDYGSVLLEGREGQPPSTGTSLG